MRKRREGQLIRCSYRLTSWLNRSQSSVRGRKKDPHFLIRRTKCIVGIRLHFFGPHCKQLVAPSFLAYICVTALMCHSSKQSDCSVECDHYIQSTNPTVFVVKVVQTVGQEGVSQLERLCWVNSLEAVMLESLLVFLKLQSLMNNDRPSTHDVTD